MTYMKSTIKLLSTAILIAGLCETTLWAQSYSLDSNTLKNNFVKKHETENNNQ